MNQIFKQLPFFVSLLIITSGFSMGQQTEITISGLVLNSKTDQPVEFATIAVNDSNTQKPISGTTTNLKGEFSLTTASRGFYIEVSFIGFEKKSIRDFEIENGVIDLGVIKLDEDNQLLEEIIVRGEKSQTEFRLDKRVFNVGRDLSTTGASAMEVLNNVPSVNVSIEGDISLRGSSGVQILINGKPSVLTGDEGGNALGTITADMIDKIEVITNPSAKYDAEGTSGIINIVIKKEDRKGTNGSISLNTGTPHNHSIGFSLNHRTEKFNLFTQLGAGYRKLPNDIQNINTDRTNNQTVTTVGEEFRNENFYNFILGTDYNIDDRNIITVSGNFSYEIEDQPSFTQFSLIDDSREIISSWERNETTEATNPKYQYEVNYKRDFKDNKDHTLLFSALGSFFGKDLSSEFNNTTTFGDDLFEGQQLTRTKFNEAEYTFKLDYTKPLSEYTTIETGAQYVSKDVSNDFAVQNEVEGELVNDLSLTNIFEFDQKVFGAYGTYAFEKNKWGYKLGLRLENTELKTLLINTSEENNQNYTNLFPSAHASYKLSKNYSVQGGYSRRIFRPRLWDLNPFFNIRNNFSIRTGNPNLQPEFTDSYEVSMIYDMKKTSMNASIYHRYTTDVVERISIFENNVNTTRPENIGINRATGFEYNIKYSPKKWLTINGDFNYNFFSREGALEGVSFDFNADQWSTKLNSKFKLPADIDVELTGQYRSKVQTVQSEISDNLFFDLGARKKILKGKGVLNFSVRDLFAARVRESITDLAEFFTFSRRQRGRFITLGFSYGFGKGEAMEFSGSRRR